MIIRSTSPLGNNRSARINRSSLHSHTNLGVTCPNGFISNPSNTTLQISTGILPVNNIPAGKLSPSSFPLISTSLAKFSTTFKLVSSVHPGNCSTTYPPTAVHNRPLNVAAAARAHARCSLSARYIPTSRSMSPCSIAVTPLYGRGQSGCILTTCTVPLPIASDMCICPNPGFPAYPLTSPAELAILTTVRMGPSHAMVS
mmetsp:Transcript_3174/g.5922  ORF Transcript_3174/g.5922 Transcript_3174/m.5922 type:complete len:200 (-) Transcript_3174:706-1305(-)